MQSLSPSNVRRDGQRKLTGTVTHCKGKVRDKISRRTPKISKICLMMRTGLEHANGTAAEINNCLSMLTSGSAIVKDQQL